MNIHDRPYKCPVTSCMSHSDGFATKGVLDRHKAAKHPNLTPRRGKKEYYCPQQGCHRSIASPEKNPFKRKDHLHEHIKRIHNNFVTQAPVPVQDDPLTRIIRDQRASAVGDETGEYIFNNNLHTTTARSREKRHEEDVVTQANTATSRGEECCRHGQEVEALHRKMADIERRLEASEARQADLSRKLRASKEKEAKLADLLSLYTKQSDD